MRKSKKIITISEFTKMRISEKFSRIKKPTLVAYCGISDIFIKTYSDYAADTIENVKERYKLPHGYILCLGTLEPRKKFISIDRSVC